MSTFGATSTTDEVLAGHDLTGRHIMVTGANSGLGEEATRALAAKGASITMLGRDLGKLEAAAGRIRKQLPGADLAPGVVDLASFESIRSFAAEALAGDRTIDVLMNNAGVMCCPEGQTADGFEMQFGTNHLGHFLLTALLKPAVMASDSPRVVNLSSAAHSMGDVNLDDINFEQTPYNPWEAYGRSKTANALFSRGLAQRFGDAGLVSNAVHPGGIHTNLGRHFTAELRDQMIERLKSDNSPGEEASEFEFKPIEAGAATQVWAATASEPAAHNGCYLADCQIGVEGENTRTIGFASYLLDDNNTERLWTMSEELTGQEF